MSGTSSFEFGHGSISSESSRANKSSPKKGTSPPADILLPSATRQLEQQETKKNSISGEDAAGINNSQGSFISVTKKANVLFIDGPPEFFNRSIPTGTEVVLPVPIPGYRYNDIKRREHRNFENDEAKDRKFSDSQCGPFEIVEKDNCFHNLQSDNYLMSERGQILSSESARAIPSSPQNEILDNHEAIIQVPFSPTSPESDSILPTRQLGPFSPKHSKIASVVTTKRADYGQKIDGKTAAHHDEGGIIDEPPELNRMDLSSEACPISGYNVETCNDEDESRSCTAGEHVEIQVSEHHIDGFEIKLIPKNHTSEEQSFMRRHSIYSVGEGGTDSESILCKDTDKDKKGV